MAVINFSNREITTKIVYFGASKAGCNTNIQRLHALLPHDDTRRAHRFGPRDANEQSWYFNVDSDDDVKGFSLRHRVYSLPGGVTAEAHRLEVMRNVDAIVLVVDARSDAVARNEEALLALEDALSSQELDLAALPVVLQINHIDRDGAKKAEDVVRDLNPYGFPVISSSAREGAGVLETFDALRDLLYTQLLASISEEGGPLKVFAINRPTDTDADTLTALMRAVHPGTSSPTIDALHSDATPPGDQIEVPFQPKTFAGSYPIRVIDANLDDGQVFVDIELERMGGGEVRTLRVKLANRPTDAPAALRSPVVHISNTPSPVMGVTDHLPDVVPMNSPVSTPDFPAVWYGVLGLLGGVVSGFMAAYLLFR